MKNKRYKIRFPSVQPHQLAQNEAYFLLEEESGTKQLRFHDYGQLYLRPGLYEQLFYDRLKCDSPRKVAQLLNQVIHETPGMLSLLRVLDVGAGNGVMGEALAAYGVARLVGIDILDEAYKSVERDRPGLYDGYYVVDLTNLSPAIKEELLNWKFDCMTCVAALGFDDIPPKAFAEAFNLIEVGGWIAFNIKETFLDKRDHTGFSTLVKELMLNEYLHVHHLERYRHRISIDGMPLHYFAVVGKKNMDIAQDFFSSLRAC